MYKRSLQSQRPFRESSGIHWACPYFDFPLLHLLLFGSCFILCLLYAVLWVTVLVPFTLFFVSDCSCPLHFILTLIIFGTVLFCLSISSCLLFCLSVAPFLIFFGSFLSVTMSLFHLSLGGGGGFISLCTCMPVSTDNHNDDYCWYGMHCMHCKTCTNTCTKYMFTNHEGF